MTIPAITPPVNVDVDVGRVRTTEFAEPDISRKVY